LRRETNFPEKTLKYWTFSSWLLIVPELCSGTGLGEKLCFELA
jgi:hypothetical protein